MTSIYLDAYDFEETMDVSGGGKSPFRVTEQIKIKFVSYQKPSIKNRRRTDLLIRYPSIQFNLLVENMISKIEPIPHWKNRWLLSLTRAKTRGHAKQQVEIVAGCEPSGTAG